MKKLLYIMGIMLLIMGCKKKAEDGHDITLSETTVILHKNDEYSINAESPLTLYYTSDNEYHAIVSNQGVIKGRYVGTTSINISNNYLTKTISVTVNPRYNSFNIPDITFEDTRDYITQTLGTPDYIHDDGKTIGYWFNNGAPEEMEYHLTNDLVVGYKATFYRSLETEIKNYLGERYKYQYSKRNIDHYINALETIDATMRIDSYEENTRYWVVTYSKINF